MKIAATVHVNGLLDQQAGPGRFELESAALERLTHRQVEALCSVLGAGDASELAPRLYRLAAVSLQPQALMSQMLAHDGGAMVTFAFELASYQRFMDRLLAGDEPAHDIADTIEREQRTWLSGLIVRFRQPGQLLPDANDDIPDDPGEDTP